MEYVHDFKRLSSIPCILTMIVKNLPDGSSAICILLAHSKEKKMRVSWEFLTLCQNVPCTTYVP